MNKLSRLWVLLGLLAGASTLLPVFAQEGPPPGPESGVLESFGIAIETGAPPPFPMGMPGMSPGGMSQPFTMPLPDGAAPDEIIAFHHGGGGDLMMLKSLTDTAFSDEQLEKLYSIKSEFQDKAGARMVELMSSERNLHDMLTQPELDRGKAQSLQSKINNAKADLANLKLDERMSLLAVLTPEQRKELRRNYVKRMDFGMGGGQMRHRFMKSHRGGPGGGPGHGGGDKK